MAIYGNCIYDVTHVSFANTLHNGLTLQSNVLLGLLNTLQKYSTHRTNSKQPFNLTNIVKNYEKIIAFLHP